MANHEIDETTLNVADLEIGGDSAQRLIPSNISIANKYIVKSYAVVPTEWGKRIDYLVADSFQEWLLSSWNIVSKNKFKVDSIIGKTIELSPMPTNKKKLLLKVVD